jgi:hypothetical protein
VSRRQEGRRAEGQESRRVGEQESRRVGSSSLAKELVSTKTKIVSFAKMVSTNY